MKYIGYIFLIIALFIIGVASYFIIDEKAKEKKRIAASTAKAREAKAIKALLKDAEESDENAKADIEELHKTIIENGSKEKTVKS